MKRSIFIIIGVVIVVLLLAVWVYLLFFNTPNSANDEVFADLRQNNSQDQNAQPGVYTTAPTRDTTVNINSEKRLRQLTLVQ
jgi:flagellar basal body-associated protein FliL